ncbi:sialoadhesin-like [Clarias gariepinus]
MFSSKLVNHQIKPVVIINPDTQVYRGERVTFRCNIQTGGDTKWTYSWYKNDNTQLRDTTQDFSIRSVRHSDGGKYTCRGRRRDSQLSQISDPVTLSVSGESPPVSLIISPSRTQHFTADSLSLSCEDQRDSTGWTVRGRTNGTLFNCSSVSGSTCNISSLSTSHTGVYWCQSESGGRSNSLNITVHNGDVILESPVHPVTEGNPLTLRCLYRNTNISDSGIDFYKDGSVLQNKTTGEMTISSVSMSDEGFYHCTHPERGESPKSWVSVRVLSHEKAPQSVLKLLSSVVAASPYVLVTIILAVKCYRARTEPTENKRPESVIEAEASS